MNGFSLEIHILEPSNLKIFACGANFPLEIHQLSSLGFTSPCYGLSLTSGVKLKNDYIFQNCPPAAGPKTLIFCVLEALWEFDIFKNFPPAAGYQHVIFSWVYERAWRRVLVAKWSHPHGRGLWSFPECRDALLLFVKCNFIRMGVILKVFPTVGTRFY